jgi:hypothetical protein
MKNVSIFLLILIVPSFLFAQNINSKSSEKYLIKIDRNIYRLVLTEPLAKDYETNAILSFNYERQIVKAFSLSAKMGIGTSIKKFGPIGKQYQYSFHAYSNVEARYYFTLNRRIRKEKYIKNFSSPYLSVEQNLFTNSIGLINQNTKDAMAGNTATYLNLGYQIQTGKLYLGAFFGVQLAGKSFSKYADYSLSILHGGVNIGYVF